MSTLRRGRVEVHFQVEVEVLTVGEIELDRPPAVDSLGPIELEVREIVAGDGQICVLARDGELGVERYRLG